MENFYNTLGRTNPKKPNEMKLPILYSTSYNISFAGLEKLHPFDSCKYGNIMKSLIDRKFLKEKEVIKPKFMPSEEILRKVHTPEYLQSLNSTDTIARITEISIVSFFPIMLVRSRVLNPMLYATSGSILAGKVAMERGWAINLSGGYHHCSGSRGGGFCAYADITLSYRILRENFPSVKKVMIIDLDAHQGNGHERDKITFNDQDLYICDIYNGQIYPGDTEAKRAIDTKVELHSGTSDSDYLGTLRIALAKSFSEFTPDVIYYNAGTDILQGDPLGCLNITPKGVIERDQIVFNEALERKIPIVMLLSGGYQKTNAQVIADSVVNLDNKLSLVSKIRSNPPSVHTPS